MKTISDDLKEKCRELNCILLGQIKEPGATFISLDSYKNLVNEWNLLLKTIDDFLSDKNNSIDGKVCELIQKSFMMFLCTHNQLNHEISEGIEKAVGENTSNCLEETVNLFNNNFIAN